MQNESFKNLNIKVEAPNKDYKEISEYILSRLEIRTSQEYDLNQFKDFTIRVSVSIPEIVLPADSRKEISSGGFFWVEQSLRIMTDIRLGKLKKEDIECEIVNRLKNPPIGPALMHFYSNARVFSKYINNYGKVKIKIYLLSCLLKFIDLTKKTNPLNCLEYEVLTDQRFANYLISLGFRPLEKSKVVSEAKTGAFINCEKLLSIEPLLTNKLAGYLNQKDEILELNNHSRKMFDL